MVLSEINFENPENMYKEAKVALWKYLGHSSISNISKEKSKGVDVINDNIGETSLLSMSSDEYETFVAYWKKQREQRAGSNFNRNGGKKNFSSYNTGRYRHPASSQEFSNSYRNDGTGKPKFQKYVAKKLNANGMQCHVCKSITHLVRDCPDKIPADSTLESYVSLSYTCNNNRFSTACFNNNNIDAENNFCAPINGNDHNVIECDVSVQSCRDLNWAILDSGCLSNVSGKMWVECYLECLDSSMKSKVKRGKSTNKYKFGGGRVCSSLYVLEVPFLVAGQWKNITFDVVDSEIPLLLGKKQWKEWNMKLDAGQDCATVKFGESVRVLSLCVSSGGHWCLDLSPGIPSYAVNDILLLLDGKNVAEKKSAASHLHRALAHPSFNSMRKALSVLDNCDAEFEKYLKDVSEKCQICKVYKPTRPRPVVSPLLSPEKMRFNYVVTLDLKQWKQKHILYMIDMATRYTRAQFIPNRNKETIVTKIIELWVSLFGAPIMFYADGGGEFANSELTELGNQYGVIIKHTAAYSPWANGLNERNHATVDLMLQKMLLDDSSMSEDMALQYVVSVRNNFMFINGFTPSQLVFGQNPRLPLSSEDSMPALEGVSSSAIIADNLNSLSAAREAFVKMEVESKFRRALKHPVRSYVDVFYKQGDRVYFKVVIGPGVSKRWQGPATVIGVEDKNVVIIKFGNYIRRIHPRNLQLVEKSLESQILHPDPMTVNHQIKKTKKNSKSEINSVPSNEKIQKVVVMKIKGILMCL